MEPFNFADKLVFFKGDLHFKCALLRIDEALFALAVNLGARYSTTCAQIDKLTRSLLANAFRGELVLQDPIDEQAEKLLVKKNAQRDGAVKVPKGKMKKTG